MKRWFTIPREGDVVALMHSDERAAMDANDRDGDTHLTIEVESVDSFNGRFELPMFYSSQLRCSCTIPYDGTVQSLIQGLAVARSLFNHAIVAYA